MNTKIRSDAVLLNLPEENKEILREALLGGMGYLEALALAQTEFDVVASRATMGEFWKRECWPVIILRRADDAENAETLVSAAQLAPGRFTEAAREALEQRLFNLANNPNSKPSEIAMLSQLLCRERESSLKARATAVQEARLAIDKRAAELVEEDAAPERRLNKIRHEVELGREAGLIPTRDALRAQWAEQDAARKSRDLATGMPPTSPGAEIQWKK